MNENKHTPLKDERLADLLGKPEAPAGLARQLRQNLHEQINHERRLKTGKAWRMALAFSLAANVLFAFIAIVPLLHDKDSRLLEMAYAHVQHEHELDGHFVKGVTSDWLADRDILPPPAAYTVGLAKDCLIGLEPAKHMRVVNQQNDVINLLIFSGQMPAQLPAGNSGVKGEQHWVWLHAEQGPSLLAFYGPATSTATVKKLVDDMLVRTGVEFEAIDSQRNG